MDLMEGPVSTAEYLYSSDMGADIEEEQAFQAELHEIVDEMKVNLVDETKILEGTIVPEYGKGDWVAPTIEKTVQSETFTNQDWEQNELSSSEHKDDQWKTNSPNGFLTTVHIPIFNDDLSSSSSSARPSSPISGILDSSGTCMPRLGNSYKETLDVSGCAIDVTNVSFACMEQMINERLRGTQSDLK